MDAAQPCGRRAGRATSPGRRAASALVTGLAALASAACTGGDGSDSGGEEPNASVAVAQLDLSDLSIPRAPFCDALSEGSVRDLLEQALGGSPTADDAYNSGDRVRVAPRVRDVVAEEGCAYRRGAARAEAWVFRAPVARGRARTLVADLVEEKGCQVVDGPRFGRPGTVLTCQERDAGRPARRTALAGLFGDAWLTCEVVTPRPPAAGTVEAAQRWCAGVAQAAAG